MKHVEQLKKVEEVLNKIKARWGFIQSSLTDREGDLVLDANEVAGLFLVMDDGEKDINQALAIVEGAR